MVLENRIKKFHFFYTMETMNKRQQKVHYRVGIFILCSLFIFFGYLLTIGDSTTLFRFTTHYRVLLKEATGLFEGSLVTINGIPAGNVKKIEFLPDTGEVDIEVAILDKFVNSVTNRSRAFLVTMGLLGDRYIEIQSVGTKGTSLIKGSYIPTKGSAQASLGAPDSFLNVFGEETALTISSTFNEIKTFFQKLNKELPLKSTNELLQNIQQATLSLESATKSIDTFFSELQGKEIQKNVLKSLKRLDNIIKKIEQGEGTLGGLINNKNIYYRILSILGQRPHQEYLPQLVED